MSEKKDLNSAFARVIVARQPERPYSLDLFEAVFEDFTEIHGDRRYSDDPALICGVAKLEKQEVVLIGQQKGRDTSQRRFRNFGMPKPEGYRKALRAMKFAEKFGRPVISFIDTPGAYPGIDAEERGQAEAIALNLREMANLRVPLVIVVLGEGGSGGALGIGVGDRVLMMENSVYSVITPEGCAAILWKDSSQARQAAECLRLTAENLLEDGIIDGLISEPAEWKISSGPEDPENQNERLHADYQKSVRQIKKILIKNLSELQKLDAGELLEQRFQKFRAMGKWKS